MILARMFVGADNKTGALDIDKIAAVAIDLFPDGLTIYPTIGVWNGGREHSLCIERLGEYGIKAAWNKLAATLKAAFDQQAVLVEYLTIDAEFI